jgi:dihydrofolate reductase
MRRIIGGVFLSLDGVMQAPGGPNEDESGGFPFGGWFVPYVDEAVGQAIGTLFGRPYDLLLGRRTWEIFAAHWPFVEGEEAEMGRAFTAANKYVLTGGGTPLEWENSHALADMDAVAALKNGTGPDLIVQGSSTLYPELLRRGLIDELTLLTCPVVLGRGKPLFGDTTPGRELRLIDHVVSPGGVVIATYVPSGEVRAGSFAMDQPSVRELDRRARIAAEDAR